MGVVRLDPSSDQARVRRDEEQVMTTQSFYRTVPKDLKELWVEAQPEATRRRTA